MPELTDDILYLFREILQKWWSMNPNDRPTFNDIENEPKNNRDYIIQNIDENDFYEYIDFIDNEHSSFDINKSVQAKDLRGKYLIKGASDIQKDIEKGIRCLEEWISLKYY